jgi:tetratricopeptide (TPR) repeat protein
MMDLALKCANKSIQFDPDCFTAYDTFGDIYSGRIFWSNDYISKTEYVCNKAINLNPSDWRSMLNLGELKRKIELHSESLKWIERAADIYPNNAHIYLTFGNIYSDIGDYDQAEFHMQRSIEILPEFGEAYGSLALLYLEEEAYDKAIETFLAGIKKGPPMEWLHHDLAAAYKDCGRFEEAIAEFKTAVRINPSQRYHYLGLATVYVEKGEYDKAIQIYQMVESKFSDEINTALNHSFILNLKGDMTNARRSLEKFLSKSKFSYQTIDRGIFQIVLFYLGKISEREMLDEINMAKLKLKLFRSFSTMDYYIGMAHLLNLKAKSEHQQVDTVRAINYLHKYVTSKSVKSEIEYSLAKAQLKELTK